MNELRKLCFASVVSELQQSDIYLIFKARLFEATVPNLNDVAVTEAFVDEIVENQEKYISMPLMADIKNLISGNYEKLGHMYDPASDEFHSTQIGSFYKYEKETVDNHVYLVGYGKVLKRNKAVCKAMSELFATGNLKFSFEVVCSSYSEREDGVMQIDAAEDNFLEAMSIVFNPAYESAVALELVAECAQISNGEEKGDEKMNPETEKIEVEEAEKELPICPVCGKPHTPFCKEKVDCDNCEDCEDTETEDTVEETEDAEEPEAETAEAAPEEEVTEDEEVEDAACKEKAEEETEEVEDAACNKVNCEEEAPEETVEEAACKEQCSEETTEDAACKVKREDNVNSANAPEYATKEDIVAIAKAIEELSNRLEKLEHVEKASLISEKKKATKKANPFLSEINTPKKYSLLEPDTFNGHYTLLDEE